MWLKAKTIDMIPTLPGMLPWQWCCCCPSGFCVPSNFWKHSYLEAPSQVTLFSFVRPRWFLSPFILSSELSYPSRLFLITLSVLYIVCLSLSLGPYGTTLALQKSVWGECGNKIPSVERYKSCLLCTGEKPLSLSTMAPMSITLQNIQSFRETGTMVPVRLATSTNFG